MLKCVKRWRGRGVRSLCKQVLPKPAVAIESGNPEVLRLLTKLSGLNLDRVMAKRREPLVVPHYQLMTLEELEHVGLFGHFCFIV